MKCYVIIELFAGSLTTVHTPNINNNNNENNENTGDDDADLATSIARSLEEDDNSVQLVTSHLVADFLAVTNTDNVQMAKMYLERAAMNIDRAILLYYEQLS